VPVLWDIGQDVSRKPPFALSPALSFVLQQLQAFDKDDASADRQ